MKHLPTRFLSLKFPTSKIKFDSIAKHIHTFLGSTLPFFRFSFQAYKITKFDVKSGKNKSKNELLH